MTVVFQKIIHISMSNGEANVARASRLSSIRLTPQKSHLVKLDLKTNEPPLGSHALRS